MTADGEADMTTSATAELLVLTHVADVVDAVRNAATGDDPWIELTEVRAVPWAGGIVALRSEGRCTTRGRTVARIRIGLVETGPVSTLLMVALAQPGGRIGRGATRDAADALARRLRDTTERAQPVSVGIRATDRPSRDRVPPVLVAGRS